METTIELEEPAIVHNWWYFDKQVTEDISVFKVPKFIPSLLYLYIFLPWLPTNNSFSKYNNDWTGYWVVCGVNTVLEAIGI